MEISKMFLEVPLLLITILLYIPFRWMRPRKKLPPGPSGLPIVGYLPFLASNPTQKITELSSKYGPLVSVKLGQQRVLFVNDVATMREMGRMDVFLGRHQLEIIRDLRENRGLIFLERHAWSEWRRFTLHTLKNMGFGKRTMETLILDELQDLSDFIRRNLGKPLYLKDFTDIVAVNSLWEILTGEKFDLEDEEKHRVLKTIEEGIADQSMMGLVTFLPSIAKLFPSISGWDRAVKCFGSPFKLIRETLDRHVAAHECGREKDFIDFALTKIYTTVDPFSCFYKERGMDNLFFTILDLFITGSDSVSSTVSWAFLFVSLHPEIQKRIQREIDEVLGDALPSLADRSKLIYTEATMLEVLRRSSIVPFGVMHTALEDVQDFHGYFIPKRTVILWNLYHVHHDPEYWDDPQCFRPERFINGDETLRKEEEEHLVPFFTGKRSCPAESVALSEFFLFFTGVLQKFKLELVEHEEDLYLGPKPGFCASPPKHHIVLKERVNKAL